MNADSVVEVNLEEEILFNVLGLFSRIDCNEIIFQSKKVNFNEGILYLCYEMNGERQISIDIYSSKNNIFILINELDFRFNKNDPYFSSYAIIGSYSKKNEALILNAALQSVDVTKIFEFMHQNKNKETSQFFEDAVSAHIDDINSIHILKKYNLKIQK
jgi:hypothetical protein